MKRFFLAYYVPANMCKNLTPYNKQSNLNSVGGKCITEK